MPENYIKNGYNILWTDHALKELADTIEYIEINFTEKEIKRLVLSIENIVQLISKNPNIFPKTNNIDIYRVVILKFNTLYYRINSDNIEILSFFSNRQSPGKRKL